MIPGQAGASSKTFTDGMVKLADEGEKLTELTVVLDYYGAMRT